MGKANEGSVKKCHCFNSERTNMYEERSGRPAAITDELKALLTFQAWHLPSITSLQT